MKRIIVLFVSIVLLSNFIFSQDENKSVLQLQSEEYSNYNFSRAEQWDSLFLAKNPGMSRSVIPRESNNCTLNKVVYGWNPYWAGSTYLNYQWNLLSHLSHFSYELNYTDGSANTTHNWATDDAVDSALANGVKVDLCVTLMNQANLTSFLSNSTARQNLITNLINLVQTRGANGVNIDFEGMASSDSANFRTFMISLCNQMHSAIPGSEVSYCLPAVEWTSNKFSVSGLLNYVDMFIIMGYDYYYGGSSIAGPTDPLYNFETGYNYTLTKSITYYLKQGVEPSKLILGLPYYGKQWATADNSVGSATTASGTSPFYNVVRNNINGYYSNKLWNATSYTPYFSFQISSQWYQCWIDDAYSLGKRFDLINQRGIGGMGIWALGYDDGYTELWDKITDKFTSCAVVNCIDTIYDMGGPQRNYYDNESYTYTIQPSGASAINLVFNSFSVADDTLWIYDGPSVSSPLLGAYTATNSPGTISSSGDALTLKFRSRTSTNSSGWEAIWQCLTDIVPPSTSISVNGNWQTQNFTANFTDTDSESGIERRFYDVTFNDGVKWTACAQNGFFRDEFTNLDPLIWMEPANGGTWQINGGNLTQTDSSNSNTNIYAALNQNIEDIFLYHFSAKMENSVYATSQRRFGFHFFCDDASLTNRGNSYFIFFRQETSKLEFYKVTNDTYLQTKVVDNIITTPEQWYDYKITYDRNSGRIEVYRDDILLGTWTDSAPLSSGGNFISFRTGNSNIAVNSIKVYHSRNTTELIKVGSAGTSDILFQNTNPASYAGQIYSIVSDGAKLLSEIDSQLVNVDWTPPSAISEVNDGVSADVDTTNIINSISANFNGSIDPNSDIDHYMYCFGTTPGGAELIGWTNAGTSTSITRSGVLLQEGMTYYFTVFAVNGAGLASDTAVSDGVYVIYAPHADFSTSTQFYCAGNEVLFSNTSTNATSYQWNFQGGNPSSTNASDPQVVYDTSGTYDVTLIAFGPGGSDTMFMAAYIYVYPKANAAFTVNDTLVFLPSADVVFTNTSTNAPFYLWDFGDGTTSTDQSPWHNYDSTGLYTVTLIAYDAQCGNDTLVMTDLIHVESTVGINEEGNPFSASLYPNPFIDGTDLIISLESSSNIRILLFDFQGRLIHEICNSKLENGKRKFNIQREHLDMKSGIYYLRIQSDNGSQFLRLVAL